MAGVPTVLTSLFAVLLGVLLALCSPPLPWSFMIPVPLAGVLYYTATSRTTRELSGRMFWMGFGYFALHLWWLTAFLGKIFGFPPLGVLALALYAIEAGFLVAAAYPVGRILKDPTARIWGLAGAWVVLEWLRFLGPLAFPWPTLGYAWLPTPIIQIADLGGVLLGSVLIAFTAAALAQLFIQRGKWGRGRPLALSGILIAFSLVYGLTRQNAQGPEGKALLQRTTIDSFAKASQSLSPEQQFRTYKQLTLSNRQAGEVPIWTETAVPYPELLTQAPAGGIFGAGGGFGERANRVIAWTGQATTSQNDKARPVPFGEYFPFQSGLKPLWGIIERGIGFQLPTSLPPAKTMIPLTLNGVQYGGYVCYDSVFPWVARQLSAKGAQVLVNVSNDGWYEGWGVQQHFMMGRVRAIENRRWLLRSVNEGIAAAVDDLGRPQQVLDKGQGVIHARFKILSSPSLYTRVGDWPALLLALLMMLYAVLMERRAVRW